MRKPAIYFAGKVGKYDWRHEVFEHWRIGGLEYNSSCPDDSDLFNPDYKEDKGRFFYGGPFFVSCDHGCAHGANMHGADLTSNCLSTQLSVEETRRRIWQVNHERLKRADLIFAYINEPDCYGTLIELGMAQTRRKRIVLGFGTDIPHSVFDDFWMARQTAPQVYRGTPKQVWRDFTAEVLTDLFWHDHDAWLRRDMDQEFAELEAAE